MKKVNKLALKKNYKILLTDKSGNWRGGHKRGGYIIISGPGFRKECSCVAEAIRFLSK